MLILENSIVSPLLIETALRLEIPIYYSADQREFYLENHSKLLTNSESCLPVLEKYNPKHPHTVSSKLVKNKAKFRELLSSVNENYYFHLVTLKGLTDVDVKTIPFPVVIKPNKGYGSIGVYFVKEENDWDTAVNSLYADMLLSKNTYSDTVIDGEEILIEEWIDGEEYAIDCYFDEEGNPIILNILQRIFANEKDTSDRIYFTSANVIQEVKDELSSYLQNLNKHLNLLNYPFHLEVRRSSKGILPIELNPLRFAGAGTTDISTHAFGINGAECYFLNQEPQWNEILRSDDQNIYGFFCAEIPNDISKPLIQTIRHEKLKEEFNEILEYRELHADGDRTFAVIFFKSKSMNELEYLLNLDLSVYIEMKQVEENVI